MRRRFVMFGLIPVSVACLIAASWYFFGFQATQDDSSRTENGGSSTSASKPASTSSYTVNEKTCDRLDWSMVDKIVAISDVPSFKPHAGTAKYPLSFSCEGDTEKGTYEGGVMLNAFVADDTDRAKDAFSNLEREFGDDSRDVDVDSDVGKVVWDDSRSDLLFEMIARDKNLVLHLKIVGPPEPDYSQGSGTAMRDAAVKLFEQAFKLSKSSS